ncbi:hypothetical protein GGF31_003387 [Allomyces arbusculus]|nr:hypothetical protein GGF31_003387 [Allomyces arbusculus]
MAEPHPDVAPATPTSTLSPSTPSPRTPSSHADTLTARLCNAPNAPAAATSAPRIAPALTDTGRTAKSLLELPAELLVLIVDALVDVAATSSPSSPSASSAGGNGSNGGAGDQATNGNSDGADQPQGNGNGNGNGNGKSNNADAGMYGSFELVPPATFRLRVATKGAFKARVHLVNLACTCKALFPLAITRAWRYLFVPLQVDHDKVNVRPLLVVNAPKSAPPTTRPTLRLRVVTRRARPASPASTTGTAPAAGTTAAANTIAYGTGTDNANTQTTTTPTYVPVPVAWVRTLVLARPVTPAILQRDMATTMTSFLHAMFGIPRAPSAMDQLAMLVVQALPHLERLHVFAPILRASWLTDAFKYPTGASLSSLRSLTVPAPLLRQSPPLALPLLDQLTVWSTMPAALLHLPKTPRCTALHIHSGIHVPVLRSLADTTAHSWTHTLVDLSLAPIEFRIPPALAAAAATLAWPSLRTFRACAAVWNALVAPAAGSPNLECVAIRAPLMAVAADDGHYEVAVPTVATPHLRILEAAVPARAMFLPTVSAHDFLRLSRLPALEVLSQIGCADDAYDVDPLRDDEEWVRFPQLRELGTNVAVAMLIQELKMPRLTRLTVELSVLRDARHPYEDPFVLHRIGWPTLREVTVSGPRGEAAGGGGVGVVGGEEGEGEDQGDGSGEDGGGENVPPGPEQEQEPLPPPAQDPLLPADPLQEQPGLAPDAADAANGDAAPAADQGEGDGDAAAPGDGGNGLDEALGALLAPLHDALTALQNQLMAHVAGAMGGNANNGGGGGDGDGANGNAGNANANPNPNPNPNANNGGGGDGGNPATPLAGVTAALATLAGVAAQMPAMVGLAGADMLLGNAPTAPLGPDTRGGVQLVIDQWDHTSSVTTIKLWSGVTLRSISASFIRAERVSVHVDTWNQWVNNDLAPAAAHSLYLYGPGTWSAISPTHAAVRHVLLGSRVAVHPQIINDLARRAAGLQVVLAPAPIVVDCTDTPHWTAVYSPSAARIWRLLGACPGLRALSIILPAQTEAELADVDVDSLAALVAAAAESFEQVVAEKLAVVVRVGRVKGRESLIRDVLARVDALPTMRDTVQMTVAGLQDEDPQ